MASIASCSPHPRQNYGYWKLQISIPRARNFVEMPHRNLWKLKKKKKKKKKSELFPYHGLPNKIVQFVAESVARLWLQRLQIPNQVRVFLCPCVGPVSWHVVLMALYFMINLELTILSLHEYSFKPWIIRYSSLFVLIPWENFDVLLCLALCPHECILIHSDLLPILKMCVATRVPEKITWNLTLPVSITRPRQRSIFAVLGAKGLCAAVVVGLLGNRLSGCHAVAWHFERPLPRRLRSGWRFRRLKLLDENKCSSKEKNCNIKPV